jgi:hypothetical protein
LANFGNNRLSVTGLVQAMGEHFPEQVKRLERNLLILPLACEGGYDSVPEGLIRSDRNRDSAHPTSPSIGRHLSGSRPAIDQPQALRFEDRQPKQQAILALVCRVQVS